MLIGMDIICSENTRFNIHKTAVEFQRKEDYGSAEKIYRDALLTYPNEAGMILGLAGVLALQNKSEESIELIERGLPLSDNEKQKSTMHALICFLYLKCGKSGKATALAASLPHIRESREVIYPLMCQKIDEDEININIKNILLGNDKSFS